MPIAPAPAPGTAPQERTALKKALTLNEAIGELIRCHSVTSTLDENLRLNLHQCVIELELTTGPD